MLRMFPFIDGRYCGGYGDRGDEMIYGIVLAVLTIAVFSFLLGANWKEGQLFQQRKLPDWPLPWDNDDEDKYVDSKSNLLKTGGYQPRRRQTKQETIDIEKRKLVTRLRDANKPILQPPLPAANQKPPSSTGRHMK